MKNPRKSATSTAYAYRGWGALVALVLSIVIVGALGACAPLPAPPINSGKPPACKSVPMPTGEGWTFTREPGAVYGTVASRSGVVVGFARTEDAHVAWLSTRCVLRSPSNG